ncbi:hypothetical protein J2Z50_000260 [Ensifer mexicanus]|nr:hypothetical protein [Sinorhizobium mexicanum]
MIGKRPMHVLRITRLLAKATIEVGDELRRIGIGRRDRVDAAQPQFLDQAILQRLVGALDAPLGLRGVGADDVDVELVKRSPELRQAAGSVLLGSMGGAEDAMLVAVEGGRLALLLQVGLRRVQIVEGVL